MIKAALPVALLLAAPALAQTGATPPAPAPTAAPAQPMMPPPEFMTAAQAFGQCLSGKVAAAPATTTPEAAAHQAVTGCTAEKATLAARFDSWVASPSFPAAGRAQAHQQFDGQMNDLETTIAGQIRQGRSQAGAATAPAPAPTAAPAH
ncbi:hypothetical protein [Sphingomonas sp.]|uniref:hypothetical protein n=1 Tax=Sphingomonas sp. TaxID=28214 RepID=UPI003CC55B16